jgi:signal transduction histidine kinase
MKLFTELRSLITIPICLVSALILSSEIGLTQINEQMTSREFHLSGRLDIGPIFPILRAHVETEDLGKGRISYRVEGHGVTDDELRETVPSFSDNSFFPIQGDFHEEFVLSPPYRIESYFGKFQFRDIETGWLVPVELSISREETQINALMTMGNDLSLVDVFDGPLDISASDSFLILSPAFLMGIGMEDLFEAEDSSTYSMINFWFSFFQQSEDPLIVHPIEFKSLSEIQLQSQSPDGAIIPSHEIAVRFADSLIWKLFTDRTNQLIHWKVSTPESTLSIWRSDLFASGLELLDIDDESWITQIGLGLGILAMLTALGFAVFMRRRWIIPLRKLSAALSSPSGNISLDSIPESSSREVSQIQHAYMEVEERAEISETLREQLINDVAHELRTPISVIRADLEALIDEVYEPSQEKLLTLHDKTMLLQRLVEDLHELTLAQSGELPIKLSELDLTEILNSVAEAFRVPLDESGIKLLLDIRPDLPRVQADRARLQQVLFNLIENARRHSSSGAEIKISAKVVDRVAVQISVIDSGDGITAEDLTHIFERFYRGDLARSREKGGSGLGLTISKYIIEAHEGVIRAESAGLGKGSKITFSLPVPD